MHMRERRSVILHLFGLGIIEARLHAAEASLALAGERLRIRFQSNLIPVAIWTMLGLLVVGVIYRAIRHAHADDTPALEDGSATDAPGTPAATPETAPVS